VRKDCTECAECNDCIECMDCTLPAAECTDFIECMDCTLAAAFPGVTDNELDPNARLVAGTGPGEERLMRATGIEVTEGCVDVTVRRGTVGILLAG